MTTPSEDHRRRSTTGEGLLREKVIGGETCPADPIEERNETARAAIAMLDKLERELHQCRAQKKDREARLREALTILYEETADYIRINKLGDVHHNRSMRIARDTLADSAPDPKAQAVAEAEQHLVEAALHFWRHPYDDVYFTEACEALAALREDE